MHRPIAHFIFAQFLCTKGGCVSRKIRGRFSANSVRADCCPGREKRIRWRSLYKTVHRGIPIFLSTSLLLCGCSTYKVKNPSPCQPHPADRCVSVIPLSTSQTLDIDEKHLPKKPEKIPKMHHMHHESHVGMEKENRNAKRV